MARISKNSVFKAQAAKPETAMEKTTRIVKDMIDDEAEKREIKNTRLRKARLEREANTPAETVEAAPKKRAVKATAK